ncbi:unnamed protein product, partial [Meganyctiphanes norvegica]
QERHRSQLRSNDTMKQLTIFTVFIFFMIYLQTVQSDQEHVPGIMLRKQPCRDLNGLCTRIEIPCPPGMAQQTSSGAPWCYATRRCCYEAVCDPACVNGNCTAPNNCTCEEGWTGAICDI